MRGLHDRGFTLIEVLTTAAIIGVLASIVVISLQGARAKGRDAQRLTDLKNIEIALVSYKLENGFYPKTDPNAASGTGYSWTGNCSLLGAWTDGNKSNVGPTAWIPGLAPTYIQQLPTDPKSDTNKCYMYSSDGKDYMVMAHFTVESYTEANNPKPRPAYVTGGGCPYPGAYENDFAIYTPGAKCW
jgi:prepilin-type N-terminal cleavage/methylation domain-containing protein